MEFRFDANQEFQIAAVDSITGLLEGQPRTGLNMEFSLNGSFAAVPNRLDLGEVELLSNLKAVQQRNGISPDDELAFIEGTCQNGEGEKTVRFPNFSIEMETGTGKTYVYIRTMLELFSCYGLRKFIVVVPSVAIREGVLKTLQVTKKHFSEFYGNTPYRYYVYDSASLSQIRSFAESDGIEIMIMTIDSFNKALKEDGKGNVIHRPTDKLQGETPIHMVQAARPILILDEPQNMESEKSITALAALNPLFALRYSATHRNPYNIVYRLSPYEAYRQGLVKRIEVASVVQQDDANTPFLRLESITTEKMTIRARLAVHKLMKTGMVKEQSVTVKPGDSLAAITGRPEYSGFEIDEINPGEGFVRFVNDIEIADGEAIGTDKTDLFAEQIRYTVDEHLRRQKRYREAGIKVLSLFFIDKVENYIGENAIIRRLFDEAFNSLKTKYPEYAGLSAADVQGSYFAQKKRKGGSVEVLDSVSGKTEEDRAAYDLIMKDKERLLSFEEPVSFIFSHSALREGWDNPNVFQICTLNQTASEVKKRQEVGRGIRLCVDQSGNRLRDERFNILTVVANESYERFVESLQSNMKAEYQEQIENRYGKPVSKLTDDERKKVEEEYGQGILPPKPENARKRITTSPRQDLLDSPEFKELWSLISQKTRYAVKIDTEKLINDVVSELNTIEVRPPRIDITKARVQVDSENRFEFLQLSSARTVKDLAGKYALPNLADVMANIIEHSNPPVRLTRRTFLNIIRQLENKELALRNPQEFAQEAVRVIRAKLAEQLVNGIEYEKTGEYYQQSILEELPGWQDTLLTIKNKSVYEYVKCDSGVEERFAEALDKTLDYVKLFLKLPPKFLVPTPVGDYNPDWAIVAEDIDAHGESSEEPTLYLVRETKGDNWSEDSRTRERRKVDCGEKHFKGALGMNYKVVSSADELLP
jgi:type III restriction enzyme